MHLTNVKAILVRALRYPSSFLSTLFAASAAFLLAHFLGLLISYTSYTYPYEDWDEIGSFNNSRVLTAPESHRCYRYGTLDTFRFLVGNYFYEHFDTIGKTTPSHTFSNSQPASLGDPFFAFRDAAKKAGAVGPDYAYFRGVNDREPIFVTRRIYAGSVIIAAFAVGLFLVCFLRGRAGFLPLAPLLLFTNIYFFGEAALARGNAFNSLCAIAVFFLLFIYITEKRRSALFIACSVVALGTTHKFDFLFYSAPVACMALFESWREPRPLARFARLGISCLAAFLFSLLCFWPLLLLHPIDELTPHIKTLLALGGESTARGLAVRAEEFAIFSRHAFEMSPETWNVTLRNIVPLLTVFSIPFLFLTCRSLEHRTRVILTTLALWGPLHWSLLYMTSWNIVPRYLLTGMAFSVAAVCCIAHLWASSGRRLYQLGSAGLATLLLYGAIHHYEHRKFGVAIVRNSISQGDGLWLENSRNSASRKIVELTKSDMYSHTILVDQHSYTDLRYFRLYGLSPLYIHAGNFEQIIATLERKRPILVLFAPAETTPSGYFARVTHEDPAFSEKYRAYRSSVESFPLAAEFGTKPFGLLHYDPIDPDTQIQVRVLSPEALTGSAHSQP